MPKDFKERPVRKKAPARNSRKPAASARSRWPAFVAGLAVGAVATVLVFRYEPVETLERAVKGAAGSVADTAERSTRFEFYTVLPEKEIAIPDTDLEEPPRARAPVENKATTPAAAAAASPPSPVTPGERFVLQVGSFRSLADADRLKAKLAFLGLESSIQTVSLDGREKWHRVQVGPYSGRGELAEARGRLQANDFEPIALKLK